MSVLKGIYVLVISVSNDAKIDVGALGRLNFEKGLYAYVGSAQAHLEERIKRHLRETKRRFWHVDYLLSSVGVKIVKSFYKKAGKSEECRIASKICQKSIPIRNFGSSDCRCKSHLFKVEDYQFLGGFMREITFEDDRRGCHD
jgi:Uri superfamily endonuclease